MARNKSALQERPERVSRPAATDDPLAQLVSFAPLEDGVSVMSEPRTVAAPPRPLGRRSALLFLALNIAVDALTITGAFALAYWLRFESDIAPNFTSRSVSTYTLMLLTTVLSMLIVFNLSGLYSLRRGTSRIDEFYKIISAVSMGTVGSIAVNSVILGDQFVYSRLILVAGWALCIMFVTLGRLLTSYLTGVLRRRGISRQRVVLVGMGEPAHNIIERVRSHPEYGYQVCGVLSWNGVDETQAVFDVPVLGSVDDIAALSREHGIDEVILAISGASHSDLLDIIGSCEQANVSIRIYPDAFLLMTEKEVNVNDLGGLPLLSVKDVALRGWNRTLKRGFDFIFSLAVLTVTAPLLVLIALAIKIDSPGPVFFIQERVGLDGRSIDVIKFRTMKSDAGARPGWTTANDPRRTRLGEWLRRFSLDELPQFINVLLGEMSVVGPRPEQPFFVKRFSRTIPQYMRRHSEKAGITGWAQVNGMRGDTSIEERTRYDLYYVENWSLLLDLKIIVRTVAQMLRGSAY